MMKKKKHTKIFNFGGRQTEANSNIKIEKETPKIDVMETARPNVVDEIVNKVARETPEEKIKEEIAATIANSSKEQVTETEPTPDKDTTPDTSYTPVIAEVEKTNTVSETDETTETMNNETPLETEASSETSEEPITRKSSFEIISANEKTAETESSVFAETNDDESIPKDNPTEETPSMGIEEMMQNINDPVSYREFIQLFNGIAGLTPEILNKLCGFISRVDERIIANDCGANIDAWSLAEKNANLITGSIHPFFDKYDGDLATLAFVAPEKGTVAIVKTLIDIHKELVSYIG